MKKMSLIFMALLSLLVITSCEEDEKEQQIVLTLQPDGDIGKDAVVGKIVPDNNYGDLEDIHLYAWTQEGILNVCRVVIDFDLTSIPTDARIDSALLSLYFNNTSAYGDAHSGENNFIIQRITSDWDELTVTWGTQPTTITNNQVPVSGSVSATQDFTDINITALISDAIVNKDNSYGLMLKLENEEAYKKLHFASSDNPDEKLRPKLDVYYTIKK
jgi:2',3'-cyclic-nucleotide 2'-phosphodiesterase (5'-nucleotidase family)